MSVLGVVIAALAIAFDELRDRRARRSRRPRWSCWPLDDFHAFNVDFVKPESSSATFSRPALTRIVFWNDGNETIRRQDYIDAYPFRIKARKDVQILSAQVVRANGLGNALTLGDPETNTVPIEFNYLKSQQGGLFDVYHSGDSRYDVRVIGEIVDGQKLEYIRPPQYWAGFVPDDIRHRLGNQTSHYVALGCMCLTIVFGVLALTYFVPSAETVNGSPDIGIHNPLDLFTVLLQVVLLPLVIIAGRVRIPKNLRPFDRY
jgi:hypothetical protein